MIPIITTTTTTSTTTNAITTAITTSTTATTTTTTGDMIPMRLTLKLNTTMKYYSSTSVSEEEVPLKTVILKRHRWTEMRGNKNGDSLNSPETDISRPLSSSKNINHPR